MLIGRGKRAGTKRRKGDDLSSSEERRWIRKGKCGKGEISWNFKHDAHNGLGHILVYLVMIPTDEVQLLGNSTMLRAPRNARPRVRRRSPVVEKEIARRFHN